MSGSRGECRGGERRQTCFPAILLFALCAVLPSLAEEAAVPLPTYLNLPSQAHIKPGLVQEDYGYTEFMIYGQDSKIIKGRHWQAGLEYTMVPDDTDPEVVWGKLKPSLEQAGWKFFEDKPGQARTARYQKDGHDSWVMFWLFARNDVRFDVVEAGPLPASMKLTLKKPEARAEKVNPESGDFPYLAPLHGSTFDQGHYDDAPMVVTINAGKENSEDRFVASGTIFRSYTIPQHLSSTVSFYEIYREALQQAGWEIVNEVKPGGSDVAFTAHYARDGRDIWAYLHGGGEGYSMNVADVGGEDLGKKLDSECHVPLYGVNFDFNKATLRPDSEPTLQKVQTLLQSRANLRLEVQGHTDNVGTDDYNQKLSEARAQAVVDWLKGKGTAADRLTAHGYGSKAPVADNGSDEGRAKNRRVELKKQGCGS